MGHINKVVRGKLAGQAASHVSYLYTNAISMSNKQEEWEVLVHTKL